MECNATTPSQLLWTAHLEHPRARWFLFCSPGTIAVYRHTRPAADGGVLWLNGTIRPRWLDEWATRHERLGQDVVIIDGRDGTIRPFATAPAC